MPSFTLGDLVGAVMGTIALAAVAYASIVQGNVAAMTALVGVLGAAASFYLRGKVQPPTP